MNSQMMPGTSPDMMHQQFGQQQIPNLGMQQPGAFQGYDQN